MRFRHNNEHNMYDNRLIILVNLPCSAFMLAVSNVINSLMSPNLLSAADHADISVNNNHNHNPL